MPEPFVDEINMKYHGTTGWGIGKKGIIPDMKKELEKESNIPKGYNNKIWSGDNNYSNDQLTDIVKYLLSLNNEITKNKDLCSEEIVLGYDEKVEHLEEEKEHLEEKVENLEEKVENLEEEIQRLRDQMLSPGSAEPDVASAYDAGGAVLYFFQGDEKTMYRIDVGTNKLLLPPIALNIKSLDGVAWGRNN